MAANPFDQLPYLCMRHIFQYFGIRDLTTCRSVCRLFKLYADQVEMRSLVVSYCSVNNVHWHLTNRPIDFNGILSWKEFSALRPSNFQLDQRLKFLQIRTRRTVDFALLERFRQLVHLELSMEATYDRRTLTLPELRVLKLSEDCSCVLNTPKLEVLSCSSITELQFEYPETIKWLESDYVGVSFMGKFVNLEVFKCQYRLLNLDANILSAWKNLKELDLHNLDLYADSDPDWRSEFRSALLNILRKISKREGTKCYLEGVQLINESQLNDYDSMHDTSTFRLKYYRLLRPGHYRHLDVEIDYNSLMRLVPDLSDDFFEKFPYVDTLKVIGAVELERFEWFLKNLRSLQSLSLSNTSLDQAFMDKLPDIVAGRLMRLKINERLPINFNFILRFRTLFKFEAVQPFEGLFDLAEKAFQLPIFTQFQFKEGDEHVLITKGERMNDFNGNYDNYYYDLKVHRSKNDQIGKLKCYERNLRWTKLIAFWAQRKSGGIIGGGKRFKARH